MSTETLKTVALNHVHEALGAKMIPFAGYNMPVRYVSQIEEHHTVRRGVGVFDVSHMGEFLLEGSEALALIQAVTSNDAAKLVDGKVQYSCLPNETGGIVDDLLVYRMNEQKYLLVVNASNIDKDWAWISQKNTFGVKMTNISDDMSLLAVQGPKAAEALQSLTSVVLADMEYYSFKEGQMAGVDTIISATGYTGAGGFELYVRNEFAEKLWNAVFEAGKPYDIKPIGLAARDTLRLEMGFCLYGNDIDDSTSPLEAGLGWITKFTKDFTNSAALLKQKESGVSEKLVGFEMIEKGIPRQGYELFDANNQKIGRVTSGTQSPTMDKGIGMAYLQTSHSKVGTEVYVDIRGKKIKAIVAKLPFVSKK
ncbi:MAG: glycine cleavage system aminomethyltransferase GcvT [Cytophagales bacterium]|nr:MAG: glycine cleavage system aminomethyltransferase GcvT [Cytophagales bacterium]TAF60408.1 MAG: glycine cleavage system aminomethyltransferase GcvT [Cytophagales bacterium]